MPQYTFLSTFRSRGPSTHTTASSGAHPLSLPLQQRESALSPPLVGGRKPTPPCTTHRCVLFSLCIMRRPMSRASAALGRGALFAKAACLVATAASLASSSSSSSYAAAATSLQQQDGSKHDDPGTAGRMAIVFPIAEIGRALGRIADWSTACSDDVDLPVDLVLYVDPEEARAYDLDDFNFVAAENIYQIFTDPSVRRHFDAYEAIAVLDWESVEVLPDSFARLYREVFDRPRPRRWWVMAADAAPLEAGEAQERGEFFEKRLLLGSGGGGGGDAHLVWSINGKAVVYNNRSRGLRRFFGREMSPLLRDQPFHLALWATLSLTPLNSGRWGGIVLGLVTFDGLIGSPPFANDWEGHGRPIFLETSGTDCNDRHSSMFIGAVEEVRGGILRHPRQDDRSTEPEDEQQQQHRRRRQQRRRQPQQQFQNRIRASDAQKWREEERTRAAEAEAQPQPQARHEAFADDTAPQAIADDTAPPQSRPALPLPLAADPSVRGGGNVCAFVPAYPHQRPFAQATVESILRLMPGVRVAIAADPSEIVEYRRYAAPLPDVRVSSSVDVRFSAVSADLRCGEGTELILYLEPGTILSRPFTKWDTHDPQTGELLVMYTDAARAGTRREAAFTASAGKLLGGPPENLNRNLPLFSAGTDLLLPVSANRDLRNTLTLPGDLDADWQAHLASLGRGCRGSEVSVPQALASAAFLAARPGVVFRGAPGGAGDFVRPFDDEVDEEEPWQLVLKPRFGCQFYSEVYHLEEGGTVPLIIGTDELFFSEAEIESAAESLRTQLVLFERGEDSCASGLIRVPWSSLMDPESGAGLVSAGREQDEEPRYYDYRHSSDFYASASTLGADPYPSAFETAGLDNYDYAGVVAAASMGDREKSHGADRPALETGRGFGDDAGVATFLRSSRHAEAAAAAATATATGAAASFFSASAAAADEEPHYYSPSSDEPEVHNDGDVDEDDDDGDAFSANAAEALVIDGDGTELPAPAPSLNVASRWEEVEGYSDSSVEGYKHYAEMISRFAAEAEAASAAAEAAIEDASAAVAASAAIAAGAAADAAAVVNGVPPSAKGEAAGGGGPHQSLSDAVGDGGYFAGKTRRSSLSPGVGEGVGRVALAKK